MAKRRQLSRSMTESQFENGYWYASDIKAFAKELGISPVSTLRKDELEELIVNFLRTGTVGIPRRRSIAKSVIKDSETILSRNRPIVRYTNDRKTKEFIHREAKQADPKFVAKSGAMYRLNRWREEQIGIGKKITYGDLVDHYVQLCHTEGPFDQAPSGRYINFVSDFLDGEENASRELARQAWAEVKRLDLPKTYKAWRRWVRKK